MEGCREAHFADFLAIGLSIRKTMLVEVRTVNEAGKADGRREWEKGLLTPRRAAFAAWLALAPDFEGFFEDLALLPVYRISVNSSSLPSRNVSK